MSKTVAELVDDATEIVRRYMRSHRTSDLKDLAPVVVELRSQFRLEDGRQDWSGRSPGYRQAMADVYARARIPKDQLDTLQSALRYHVGNILRERASKDDLISVGLTTVAPKERIQTTRDALHAMKEVSAPRQDVARLAAYAQALLEYIDDATIPALPPERAEASKLALEAIQRRAAELLVRLADVKTGRGRARPAAGRHRPSAVRGV